MSLLHPEKIYDSLADYGFEEFEQQVRNFPPDVQQFILSESVHLAEMEAEACKVFGPDSKEATELGEIALAFHCFESRSTLHQPVALPLRAAA